MAIDEQRIQAIGEELFQRMRAQRPGLFDTGRWTGQVLEWAMRDPAFKTEMFRFVDVFPVLRSQEELARHVDEYLLRPGLDAPAVIKMALKGARLTNIAGRFAGNQIAKNMRKMAERFIAGQTPEEALSTLRGMWKDRLAFTVDILGEAVVSEAEADAYTAAYLHALETLAKHSREWPEQPLLERDDRGRVPRVNLSVKVSALYSQLDPASTEASVEAALVRLKPVMLRAKELGAFINLDVETHRTKGIIHALLRRVLDEPELEGFEDAGIVIQAYLRDAEEDLRALIHWARRTGRRITVRLVKGAYWDYETVRAAQESWPSPVWRDKADTDACFERLSEMLMANHDAVRPAIGSHNLRSLAHALACAEAHGISRDGVEVQTLFGMAEPVRAAALDAGLRVRVYTPIGELIPGMAYLVRRLLENTSNQSWLRMGFVEQRSPAELLAPPEPKGRDPHLLPQLPDRSRAEDPGPFVNEPVRDFADEDQRAAFAKAVAAPHEEVVVRPVIDGQAEDGGATMRRMSPSDGSTPVATVHLATVEQADRAVAGARAAFDDWSSRPATERVDAIFGLAAAMRAQRDELSALICRESGKPWGGADGDVCEAIDFLEYYGRTMLGLAEPRVTQPLPGEDCRLGYVARGVCVVIAPWNFPLAILTGMSSAALVTGNTVVLKPAEQSSAIAAKMVELAHRAGIPKGALQLLPGVGEEIGPHLVSHPDVVTVAFTGSLAVGLQIWEAAARTAPGQTHLRRVVCEMGGKNAIIVDADADLDEAVAGVVDTAFGYAGQKCSACSRVVVHDSAYEAFMGRLTEAARSVVMGPATDPATRVGPVIDEEAKSRIDRVVAEARGRNDLLVGGEPHPGAGTYVTPTIFAGVDPQDPLAQQEVFGPVLAVMRAADLEEAVRIANSTRFALTAGLYSRAPSSIAYVRQHLRAGNVYINRGITGAIVERHPFGGSRMSGAGTKAGDRDYLLNFLDPRVVSESTIRRGFTPDLPT